MYRGEGRDNGGNGRRQGELKQCAFVFACQATSMHTVHAGVFRGTGRVCGCRRYGYYVAKAAARRVSICPRAARAVGRWAVNFANSCSTWYTRHKEYIVVSEYAYAFPPENVPISLSLVLCRSHSGAIDNITQYSYVVCCANRYRCRPADAASCRCP